MVRRLLSAVTGAACVLALGVAYASTSAAEPVTPPPYSITNFGGTGSTFTVIGFNNTTSNVLVTTPGTANTIQANLTMPNINSGNVYTAPIGFVGFTSPFSNCPGGSGFGSTDTQTSSFTAPATTGVYYVTAFLGPNFTCQDSWHTSAGQNNVAVVIVQKIDTTTTVTPSITAAALNEPVTFTATVSPQSGTAMPTGAVSFYVNGSATPAATVSLDGSGHATYTVKVPGGTTSVSASYSGDDNFNASASTTPATTVVACTRLITGQYSGGLTVTSGLTCLVNAKVTGGIAVAGGAVDLEHTVVRGGISASMPTSFRMCGSSASSLAIAKPATAPIVGDPANLCPIDHITGGTTITH